KTGTLSAGEVTNHGYLEFQGGSMDGLSITTRGTDGRTKFTGDSDVGTSELRANDGGGISFGHNASAADANITLDGAMLTLGVDSDALQDKFNEINDSSIYFDSEANAASANLILDPSSDTYMRSSDSGLSNGYLQGGGMNMLGDNRLTLRRLDVDGTVSATIV